MLSKQPPPDTLHDSRVQEYHLQVGKTLILALQELKRCLEKSPK